MITNNVICGFPGGSVVKNLPAVQEPQQMWIRSLSWEVPLEDGMATHSSILAWRIQWTEEPGGLQLMGSQRIRHDWSNLAHKSIGAPMPKTFSGLKLPEEYISDSLT